MGLLKKLFGKKPKNQTNTSKVIHKSKIPDYIDAANKIYNKDYDSAISDLKYQLEKASPADWNTLSMIHINLMQAYFKNRQSNPNYFELSTHHAKESLKCGHNTGLAAFRLISNLEKQKKYKQAIEVCEVVTNNDYQFSTHAFKSKNEFIQKMENLKQKLIKVGDINTDRLFSEQERRMILENSTIEKFS